MANGGEAKKKIVIFASPKCVENPKLYKDYYNVAWFVLAYGDLLKDYQILTTEETKEAVREALVKASEDHPEYREVPEEPNCWKNAESGKRGFDGQVYLAAAVARREVERALMFMDPLDTKEYLPETYAFIRNCALADIGLHINLGATFWAASVRRPLAGSFEGWAKNAKRDGLSWLNDLLNPGRQTVSFIAHDDEKEKLARFAFHYKKNLADRQQGGWTLNGTSGTVRSVNAYLAERIAPYLETPVFEAVGVGTAAHGPTGGDMVIADEICRHWPVEEMGNDVAHQKNVRNEPLSHTVVFFIDYFHAQPHEADIHVLLRTCLNPHRGVHLILNEKTAIEWGEIIRNNSFKRIYGSDQ